jgi:recombination protein RecA
METHMSDLERAVERVNKMYGQGAVMRMGGDAALDVATIETSLPSLNVALGIGGLVRGRIVEVYGPEMSGKTSLALEFIAAAQQSDDPRAAAFIDAEHSLDVKYAAAIGVRIEDLLVSQPDCGEQALEIADVLIRSGAVQIIVIDSVAALVPRSEIDGDVGDASDHLHSRLMSQAMRKICAAAARNSCTVVFTNQLRLRTGVTFGSPEVTTGGQALKFYASVRMDLRRISSQKGAEGKVVSQRTRVRIVKNKLAPPFSQAEMLVAFGHGFTDNCECVSPSMSTSDGWLVATCLACGGA